MWREGLVAAGYTCVPVCTTASYPAIIRTLEAAAPVRARCITARWSVIQETIGEDPDWAAERTIAHCGTAFHGATTWWTLPQQLIIPAAWDLAATAILPPIPCSSPMAADMATLMSRAITT